MFEIYTIINIYLQTLSFFLFVFAGVSLTGVNIQKKKRKIELIFNPGYFFKFRNKMQSIYLYTDK